MVIFLAVIEFCAGVAKILTERLSIEFKTSIHSSIETYANNRIRKLPWNLTRSILNNADTDKTKNTIIRSMLAQVDLITMQFSYVFAFIGYTFWIVKNYPITIVLYVTVIPLIYLTLQLSRTTNSKLYNSIWEKYRYYSSNQFTDMIHHNGRKAHNKMEQCIGEYITHQNYHLVENNKSIECINLFINLLSRINLLISIFYQMDIINFMIQLQFSAIIRNVTNFGCSLWKKAREIHQELIHFDSIFPDITNDNAIDSIDSIIECHNECNCDFNSILISELKFTYADGRFSFEVQRPIVMNMGQIVLLSGSSGSGKSSFMDIVAGIIPANQYQSIIKADDNLCTNGFQDFTQQRIYSEQFTNNNFNSTIRNIIIGHYDYDQKLFTKSLKVACCDDFICIGKQYSNENMMGNQLSGGQKGRILIAKIIYSLLVTGSKILILDEIDKSLQDKLALEIIKKITHMCRKKNILCLIAAHSSCIHDLEFELVLRFESGIVY